VANAEKACKYLLQGNPKKLSPQVAKSLTIIEGVKNLLWGSGGREGGSEKPGRKLFQKAKHNSGLRSSKKKEGCKKIQTVSTFNKYWY